MDDLVEFLKGLSAGRIAVLGQSLVPCPQATLPTGKRVLSLAPHPDDPEAILITLRRFRDAGNEVFFGIVSSGFGGVLDEDVNGHGELLPLELRSRKQAMRREEQVEAAEAFGLPEGHLAFLELAEDEEGQIVDDAGNEEKMGEHLRRIRPDIVLLPHGEDTNRGHAATCRMFRRVAARLARRGKRILALYNEDPKSVRISAAVYTVFDEAEASWKGERLRLHRSQHNRNIRTRGIGFDDRILGMNRRAYADLVRRPECRGAARGYLAERFQVEVFG